MTIICFLFLLLTYLSYALFLLTVIHDGERYLDAGQLTLSPLGELLYLVDPGWLNAIQVTFERYISVWLWEQVVLPLLLQPGMIVLFLTGFVIHGLRRFMCSRRWRSGQRL